ncbi:MAG: Mrp/NBP35 family ATP-binding protein [Candidatus Thorarchaeota archaeon]|jgi:Mrp family chromosome partitioning ATPase
MTMPPIPPEIRLAMERVKHKIVVLSGKGGVGKTTIATNLAMSFAMRNLAAGILDVDIYGPNVPKLLGLEGQHPSVEGEYIQPVAGPLGIKVMSMGFLLRHDDDAVAWRGPIVAKAITQFLGNVRWGELDTLVVDLPPGTGDEILSILQLIPDITGVVVVTTPQEVAVLDARRAIQLVKKMGTPILGIIENMAEFICPGCGESHKLYGEGAAERAAEEYGIEHLGRLPLDPRIIKLSDNGTPFVTNIPNSKSAEAFEAVVEKLSAKIGLS